jgi:hypothetical protein
VRRIDQAAAPGYRCAHPGYVLMRFLVALGQDVEIVVKPHRGTRRPAQLKVA